MIQKDDEANNVDDFGEQTLRAAAVVGAFQE
jgi:hypothetical protein